MFIQVKLLNGFAKPLLYQVPSDWQPISLGTLVQVPLRNRFESAIVVEILHENPAHGQFEVRAAHAIETIPADAQYEAFINQLSSYNQVDAIHFIKRVKQFLDQKEVRERASKNSDEAPVYTHKQITLTTEQQAVYDFLAPHISQPSYTPTVLHGVTGSGKTEIYKKLITHAHAQHTTTMLLLPEVTLAIQFEKLLRAQLPPTIPLFTFHSATTPKQKRALWQALIIGQPILIIGVHLPVLLPMSNLGLIIIDEEHEPGYQEKKHPKINTKEAAILRASLNKIPLLLGSATPSVTSLYNVKTRGWHFFELKNRFAGAFPTVETVLLTDKKQRRSFWISTKLEYAIKDRLNKKEQIIIFLNRRGFSFFVQCKACSFIFECHNCSVSLTLHDNNILSCHYCGVSKQLPSTCPSCSAAEDQLLKKGIGTQQMVAIIQKLFPTARIARADMDITLKKKSWQETLDQFEQGEIDILIGTQTITKGYHFPNVTLVGIIWADLNLNFPLFNAAETTLQQLIQVAGRAGRQRNDSLVIVQAMANHRIFNYINEINYPKFYEHESEIRNLVGYPPYKRLVEIELKYTNEEILDREAYALADALQATIDKHHLSVTVLGPAKPPVAKIKNTHARKLYIKSEQMGIIIKLFKTVDQQTYKSDIFFTPNPVN